MSHLTQGSWLVSGRTVSVENIFAGFRTSENPGVQIFGETSCICSCADRSPSSSDLARQYAVAIDGPRAYYRHRVCLVL